MQLREIRDKTCNLKESTMPRSGTRLQPFLLNIVNLGFYIRNANDDFVNGL